MTDIIEDVNLDDFDNMVVTPEAEKLAKDAVKSIKIDDTPIDLSKVPRVSVGDTKNSDVSQETADLYSEFNSFLETKADIAKNDGSGDKLVVPTGIQLADAVLGGGLAVGALNIIVGNPGSGKTMLAIQAMANAQKIYEGKCLCGFLDSEESTTTQRLSNLGVRYPKLKPHGDITVEKVFKYLEGICMFKEQKKMIDVPSFVIWDSIANTNSQKEREVEDINSAIGVKARILSMLMPKYVAKLNKYNISLIAINQLRDNLNIGQFAPPKDLKFMSQSKTMPGGQALKFNAFQLAYMQSGTALTTDKWGFEGCITKMKLVKNKLFSPNIEIELLGDFVKGFSNFWTNYKFLAETKRLKTGAWNYLESKPELKFRTKDAGEKYKTDPEFKAAWDKAVLDAIQVEIIEPNTVKADDMAF